MKELVEKINAAWAVFAENADKNLEGNKLQAHAHARLHSNWRNSSRNSARFRSKQENSQAKKKCTKGWP